MKILAGVALGAIIVSLVWARGEWALGRILAVPGDTDWRDHA